MSKNYKEVKLLNLNVSRDREVLFRPSILPDKWKKADPKFNEFLLNLVFNSYTPNQIKSLLHKINLPYSPEEIDKLKEHLYQKALELKNKDLPQNIFALFIDAYRCQIKDEKLQRVRNATINIVENFHSKLEVGRRKSGGYFQSTKAVKVSIYVVYENMKDRRWKKPLPRSKELFL